MYYARISVVERNIASIARARTAQGRGVVWRRWCGMVRGKRKDGMCVMHCHGPEIGPEISETWEHVFGAE